MFFDAAPSNTQCRISKISSPVSFQNSLCLRFEFWIEMSISKVKVPFKLDVFTIRTENSRILLLCSAYHYAVDWLLVVFCVKMGATGSVVVDLTGFFHSSCLNDASSGENLLTKENRTNTIVAWPWMMVCLRWDLQVCFNKGFVCFVFVFLQTSLFSL